jgi:hypothetical protein
MGKPPTSRREKDPMLRALRLLKLNASIEFEWIIQSLRGRRVFSRIRETDFLLWDATGSEYFEGLRGIGSLDVLHVRGEGINLNVRTIHKTIRNIFQGFSRSEAYFAACIEQSKPCAVFTHIDNDRRFHNLSSSFPHIDFIAIQNGMRWPCFPDRPPTLQASNYNSKMFCFSKFDVDSWNSYGASFKELQVAGSLRNSFYWQAKRPPDFDAGVKEYDICLISEYAIGVGIGDAELEIIIEFRQLLKSLGTYLKSRPSVSIVVALVSERDDSFLKDEKEFFSQYLPPSVTFCPRSASEMSSYLLADRSHVTVSSFSTLGFETLARGNRTLMAGAMISRALLSAGFHDEIWVANPRFQSPFEDALDTLLLMEDETFRLNVLESGAYFTGLDLGDFWINNLHKVARSSLASGVRDV